MTSTNKIMKGIKSFLKNKYGTISDEWTMTLMILENTIKRYIQIKEEIDKNGIYDTTTHLKNPLLSTEKDCLATILKLTQKLGITPWDYAKINKAESLLDDDDDSDDFIDSLTN